MTRYTFSTCLSFGTDSEADYIEIDVTVSYVVHAGRPETPPAYNHGGLPAEPAEVDDIRVEAIKGKPPVTGDRMTVDAVVCEFENGRHNAALLAAAADEEAYRREEAADVRTDFH